MPANLIEVAHKDLTYFAQRHVRFQVKGSFLGFLGIKCN